MFDGKIKGDYAACLTTALNFLVASTHEINFWGRFVKCGRMFERRSLKDQLANLISIEYKYEGACNRYASYLVWL
jgi:hypothetical protein